MTKNYTYFMEHPVGCVKNIDLQEILNTISKKDGGQFQVFDVKKKTKNLQRFPNPKSVIEKKFFSPKSGQLFFFLSSPNSYHGVRKFLSKTKNRIFVYGSFTMDRKVNWKIKEKS